MQSPQKPRILVVDDSPDNLMLLNMLLKEKYEVKVASNGRTALRIAAKSPHPQLILLDIQMPDMDGYAVCEQIKARAETAAIPVLFLTVRNDADDRHHGFQVGAADWIAKPIDPEELHARVSAHILPDGPTERS